MRWSFLKNGFVPSRKMAAQAAAVPIAIAASNFAGDVATGFMSGGYSNHAAKENRKWTEAMYEKYYSPQAQMRQYREAGINPLLMAQGSGLEAKSAPIGQQAVTPDFKNPFKSASEGFVGSSQMELNAAMSGNQRAQMVLNSVTAVNEAFIKSGYEGGMSMITQLMPQLRLYGMDEHQVMNMTADLRAITHSDMIIKDIEKNWQLSHGAEFRSSTLEKLNQDISESVGRLGLMSSESDLNRQEIVNRKKELSVMAAKIVETFASAYNLRKSGDKFDVDVDTARKIQKYVVSSYIKKNGLLGLSLDGSKLKYEEFKEGHEQRNYLEHNFSDFKWWLNTIGASFNTSFNFSDITDVLN